jgi:anti-sigma factor RsiW
LLTCKQFLSELGEFLDDSLAPGERQKLEEHINACPNCYVVADTTRQTIQVYKHAEPVTIPGGVKDRLMAALQRKMAAKGCS